MSNNLGSEEISDSCRVALHAMIEHVAFLMEFSEKELRASIEKLFSNAGKMRMEQFDSAVALLQNLKSLTTCDTAPVLAAEKPARYH